MIYCFDFNLRNGKIQKTGYSSFFPSSKNVKNEEMHFDGKKIKKRINRYRTVKVWENIKAVL